MRYTSVLVALALAFGTLLVSSRSAQAIPAFTRAHKVECSTCHTIYPELNEYGEAFLKNGYVYFGKGKKSEKVKTPHPPTAAPAVPPAPTATTAPTVKGEGDADKLARLKGGAMLSADPATTAAPGAPATVPAASPAAVDHATESAATEQKSEGLALAGIPELLPISFTAALNGTYNPKAVNEFDFSTRSLKLNAGGNFREKVAFFGTFVVYNENATGITNTSQTPTNLTAKDDIGELFIMWRHLFDTPVNVKIGRFQPKLGLWKINNKLSITNRYATYAYSVGKSQFTIDQPQDALELNALLGNRVFVAGGVVNRKQQNTKEGYGHVSFKLGGADYNANEPDVDLNKEETIFDYLSASFGAFGYWGENGTPNTSSVPIVQNRFQRYGAEVDMLYKLFRLRGGAVFGRDFNSDLSPSRIEIQSKVGFVEGEYSFLQNLIGAARYEYQNDGRGRIRRYIPTLAYAPIENFKIVLEYKYERATNYKNDITAIAEDFTNRIGTVGLTFSF